MKCINCEKEFKRTKFYKKLCSNNCRDEKQKKWSKKYYKEYFQRLEVKEKRKKYYQKLEVKEKLKKYRTNRYHNDDWFHFKVKLGNGIRNILKERRIHKIYKTVELIGCTPDELKIYIEKQFKPGMTWKNRKLWHIDHIIPISSFNLSEIEEQKKCFHYINLQPLWAKENLSKGSKIQL